MAISVNPNDSAGIYGNTEGSPSDPVETTRRPLKYYSEKI